MVPSVSKMSAGISSNMFEGTIVHVKNDKRLQSKSGGEGFQKKKRKKRKHLSKIGIKGFTSLQKKYNSISLLYSAMRLVKAFFRVFFFPLDNKVTSNSASAGRGTSPLTIPSIYRSGRKALVSQKKKTKKVAFSLFSIKEETIN